MNKLPKTNKAAKILRMKNLFLFIFLSFNFSTYCYAQTGIAVSPGRVFFHEPPGGNDTQYIKLTNPTNKELEIGVSFSDWNYDKNGTNQLMEAGSLDISCTDWIQVQPGTYFVLEPRETKNVEVLFNVPEDPDTSIPVRTGMLFFTQLNPGQARDQTGASIQVTVRMGVKIYHSFREKSSSDLEITGFKNYLGEKNEKIMELTVENTGELWTNGKVKWELFHKNTGHKISLKESSFHTLPGDKRFIKQVLPKDLRKGNYTLSAIVTYGEKDVLKIAELDFTL